MFINFKNIEVLNWLRKRIKSLVPISYIIPIDPAVKPTVRIKTNSSKSLGNEFTMKLIWVIWPCAPQV